MVTNQVHSVYCSYSYRHNYTPNDFIHIDLIIHQMLSMTLISILRETSNSFSKLQKL